MRNAHVCDQLSSHMASARTEVCGAGRLLQNGLCITCVHGADAQVVLLRGLHHAKVPDRFVLDGSRFVAFIERACAKQMVPLLSHRWLPLAVTIDGCLATVVSIGIGLEIGR